MNRCVACGRVVVAATAHPRCVLKELLPRVQRALKSRDRSVPTDEESKLRSFLVEFGLNEEA